MDKGIESSIARFDKAKQALALATSVDEVREIRDRAAALRLYARKVRESLEMQNMCAEIKIRAEIKLGGLLEEREGNTGSRGQLRGRDISGNAILRAPEEQPPKLSHLGINLSESSRCQRMWRIPEDRVEKHIAETKLAGKELTSIGMLRLARIVVAEETRAGASDLPDSKYRVVYADPPWRYDNKGMENYGHAERHYSTMTNEEIQQMKVANIICDDAVLFLWVTSPMLPQAFPIIESWGFVYKASFVWDKVRHNYGHYNSVRHEHLLIATRGSCTPDLRKLYDSVQKIERSKTHSQKPEEFREIIDTLYPHGNRIELFATTEAEGWDRWGSQAKKVP